MFGGSDSVSLQSGVVVRRGSGSDVSIELDRPGSSDGTIETIVISRPDPSAGIGGLEVVVSPDERLAVLFVYSGQSQQGWELFALDPAAPDPRHCLRWVASLPYVQGSGMAPVFSPDSRWLVMAVMTGWMTADREYVADVLDGSAGTVAFECARLFVQELRPDGFGSDVGPICSAPIITPIQRSMSADELFAWRLDSQPTFIANDRIELALPSGTQLEIQLPLSGDITTS